jgi:nucleotide-binding universal stress UspA family protein
VFSTAETGAGTDLLLDVLLRSGRKALAAAETRARRKGLRAETALLEKPVGRVADAIVADAKRWRADLIVMGTHGRSGFDRLLIGSNAELVARHSPVPVLLVPARGRGAAQRKRR